MLISWTAVRLKENKSLGSVMCHIDVVYGHMEVVTHNAVLLA